MVCLQDLFCTLVSAVDDFADFLIDNARSFLRIRFGEHLIPAAIVVAAVTDALIQPVNRDHGVCLFGHLFQVAECTGGNFIEHQVFSRTSTQGCTHFVEHLLCGGDLALLGKVPGSTQRLPPWHNAHLDKR